MTIHTAFFYCTCAIVLVYLGLIAYQIYFFFTSKSDQNLEGGDLPISIVVPFRNEENRILNLIHSINNFRNLGDNFEVIFVDDNSEDQSQKVIREHSRFAYSILNSKEKGKKKALETGVRAAQFDLIASLDADVRLGTDWLKGVRSYFKNTTKSFLIMPVLIEEENGLAGNFESLDVLALTGSTIAWASSSNPIMCNGANLAFRKSLFEEFRLDPQDENLASGDDLFFMHQVKAVRKNAIGYSSSVSVIAKTKAFNDIRKVMNQRVRWASKTLKYKDVTTKVVSWIVLLTFLLIVTLGVCSLFFPTLINLFLIALGTKVIVDFLFLVLLAKRFNKYKTLIYYPLAVIVQFCITPLIIVKSLWGTFEWKERHYNK